MCCSERRTANGRPAIDIVVARKPAGARRPIVVIARHRDGAGSIRLSFHYIPFNELHRWSVTRCQELSWEHGYVRPASERHLRRRWIEVSRSLIEERRLERLADIASAAIRAGRADAISEGRPVIGNRQDAVGDRETTRL